MGAGGLDPNSLLGATSSGASAGSDHQADMTASAVAEHMSSFFAAHHPSLAAVAAEGTGTHHHRAAAARYYHQQMHPSPYAATAASHGECDRVGLTTTTPSTPTTPPKEQFLSSR